MAKQFDRAVRRALAKLEPPPRLDFAEWIEANVVLPTGMTKAPGPVRLYPYQKGICDAVSDPSVERITVIKAARIGYTTLLSGIIAGYIVNDPSQILMVLPTDDDARDYVVTELEPIFAASPSLRGRLSDDQDGKRSRSTITSRRFAGGTYKAVSPAPRNLRRQSAKVLIIDEATGMKADKGEGDVISRAVTRTQGFDDRKIIEGSTLTDEASNVLLSYAKSNRSRFEVPCPECGTFTFIEWKHIRWEHDKLETAAFECPHCKALVTEDHKPSMVAAGQWIAQRPEITNHIGFHLNALVSPLRNASWGRLAAEFLQVKDSPELLQPFVNTVLAEPWLGDVSDVDEETLSKTAEPFGLNSTTVGGHARPLPTEVRVVTVGTDVQDDRLECSVVGWSQTDAFVLDHVVIYGSPDDDLTWRQHDDLLRTRWKHPLGGSIGVDAAAVDSSDGDWSEKVYAYAYQRHRQRVFAIKGMAASRRPIVASKTDTGNRKLFIIGVDGLKSIIAARLERGGTIRFSDQLEPVYYEQLISERKVIKTFAGQPRRVWERIPGRRAEALDCLVYAWAVRTIFNASFLDQRTAALAADTAARSTAPAQQPVSRRRVIPSPYVRG